MIILPRAIGNHTLAADEIKSDYKSAKTFGQGLLGESALFIKSINGFRTRYIPINSIDRVFKRLAVTKGFYNGGIFGTLSYLVVVYNGGTEKAFRFRLEDDVDNLLNEFRFRTDVPVGKK